MTSLDTTYVDCTLPGVGVARDAMGELAAAESAFDLDALCRVLYPVVRARVAYRPVDGWAGDDDHRRHAFVLVDGLGEDHEADLTTYAASAGDPEHVDLDERYDLHGDGGPEATLPMRFRRSDREAAELLRARIERAADQEPDAVEELRAGLGLPADFSLDGFVSVDDVTRIYLPFWVAAFTSDEHPDRFGAVREFGTADGRGRVRDERWLSQYVSETSAVMDRVRSAGRLDATDDTVPAAEQGFTVPDGVELNVDSLLETEPGREFADVGGMADLKALLEERVLSPLREPERYREYDLGVTNGILFHGPPGCGKTYIAGALAGELDHNFIELSPADLTSKWVGEAAENVQDVFAVARANQPCLVFLDEIDAVAASRDNDMTNSEQQMVNQLLTELQAIDGEDVVVLGATNFLEDVDDAILRSGRFDERIEVPPPDADARAEILRVHLAGRPAVEEIHLSRTVERTEGYASSDLELVAETAAREALDEDCAIDESHLRAAVGETTTSIPSWLDRYDHVDPVAAATGVAGENVRQPPGVDLDAADIVEGEPSLTLADVDGLPNVVERLRERLLTPLSDAERYESYGVGSLDGALLYGPPGCGKTTLSAAVAGDLGVPLVRVTPARLAGDWGDDPTEALDAAFEVARANAPCVVLVDDLDVLAGTDHRSGGIPSAFAHGLRGALRDTRDEEVVVLGAATLVDHVATEVLHSGCFDERIEVPPPDRERRAAVLREHVDDRLAESVDWRAVADRAAGYAVADLETVATLAMRAALRADGAVTTERLLDAVAETGSSIETWAGLDEYSDSDHGSGLRYIS